MTERPEGSLDGPTQLSQAIRIIMDALWSSKAISWHDRGTLRKISWDLHLVKTTPAMAEVQPRVAHDIPVRVGTVDRTLVPMRYEMTLEPKSHDHWAITEPTDRGDYSDGRDTSKQWWAIFEMDLHSRSSVGKGMATF
jgi:hypothetical protein